MEYPGQPRGACYLTNEERTSLLAITPQASFPKENYLSKSFTG